MSFAYSSLFTYSIINIDMNYLKSLILFSILPLFLVSCDKDDENGSMNQVENIINYNPAENYKGSYDIILQRNIALEFCKVEGVQRTDEFIARNHESGEYTYVDWGYKYAGVQGNEEGYYDRVSYNDTILVGLGFSDTWKVGEYDLLLVRGNNYQVIDQFNFLILNNIETDLTQAKGGVLNVKADGWDIATDVPIDHLEIIQKSTQKVIEKIASAYKGGDGFESISFSKEKFNSGDYELWITRWNYGFRQKICDFNFFKYEFTNSDPMQKDTNGNYYLQFYIDEIKEGDTYTVTTNSPHIGAYIDRNKKLDPANWNSDTKIYTYTLNDDSWMDTMENGMTFSVRLTLSKINITVSGSSTLNL